MAELDAVPFDAPIPGQSLTAELGARPWQNPPQYSTVEQALEYYIPRLQAKEVTDQIIDVLEMGIPVTNVADTMQTAGVLEGKHSVDVGMLILPVLVELIMLIADAADIKYTSGLEKDKDLRGSLIDKAVKKFKSTSQETEEVNPEDEVPENIIEEMRTAADERAGGLMSRSR